MAFWIESSALLEYIELGGYVMPPLILVSIVLWYALAIRLFNIRAGNLDARQLLQLARKDQLKLNSVPAKAVQLALASAANATDRKHLRALLNDAFYALKMEVGQYRMLVRSLVAVAPLLGLLGTVDGMIETFDSLAEMALFTQTGGIAGGISRALFTTQMGLAISIPGLLLGRMVERREQNIKIQLDQIRDLVCSSMAIRR
jgi:biopolymer transport protein ExbB